MLFLAQSSSLNFIANSSSGGKVSSWSQSKLREIRGGLGRSVAKHGLESGVLGVRQTPLTLEMQNDDAFR